VIPIINVVGRKDTGKTTLIEKIISELVKKGYNIMSGKHVGHDNLEFDTPNTDSYKHRKAGAKLVYITSKTQSALFSEDGDSKFNLNELVEYAKRKNIDIIILEGFSKWTRNNSLIGKIICYTKKEQLEEFQGILSKPIIATYSYAEDTSDVSTDKYSELIKRINEYIDQFIKTKKIWEKLPKLDCRSCGYANCFEFAQQILQGKETMNGCTVLENRKTNDVEIIVYGKQVPLKSFTADFVKNTTIGMISSLKQVEKLSKGKLKIIIE